MKASVVVTLFDRTTSVIEMLRAFNHQTARSNQFEVILVDDSAQVRIAEKIIGSVDTTYDISVRRTSLPYDVNGVSVARNKGIRSATGDIIISVDDDCIPNRYFIEEHLSVHRSNTACVVLGHRSERVEILNEQRPVPVTEKKAIGELQASNAGILNFLNFMTGNVSFSKAMAIEAGLFDERFAQRGEHGWEDIEFGYRLWRLGYQTLFARNAVVYRPPTEKEKVQQRALTRAVEKGRERLLSVQPQIPRVIALLTANMDNRKDVAANIGKAILRHDPDNCAVLMSLGDICFHNGRYDVALRWYFQAEQTNRNCSVVREKIGEAILRIESASEGTAA